MLMHRFTKREKVIIVILAIALVVGFYFMVIHYPVKTRLEEIELEKQQVDDETTVALAVAAQYKNMKTELEEIFALPEDEITVMPEYDNKQTLIHYFNSVFADTAPDLRFSGVKTKGSIASRTIGFNFTSPDYASAKDILRKLTGTGFRCLMQSVSLSPAEGSVEDDELRISGNIIFYELIG